MNIVFQSGDFYNSDKSMWWDLAITIIGAGIGSLASLLIFRATINHDKRKVELLRISERSEKIRYLQALVKNSITRLAEQVEFYKSFNSDLKNDLFNIPVFKRTSLLDVNRLVHKINQEEYFHAYVGVITHDDNVEEFRKLFSLLDYFEIKTQLIFERWQEGAKADFERKIKYKEIVENSIMMDIQHLLADIDFLQHKDLLDELENLVKEFYADKNVKTTFHFYQSEYVDKAKEILLRYSGIKSIHPILDDLKNATIIYTSITTHNTDFANDFVLFEEDMEAKFNRLEIISQKLLAY